MIEDLPPSKLGTKEYWDNFYATEINNFEHNPEDLGECWFSESGAEEKVTEYVLDLQPSTVLDLGTGNGHLLFALREEGVEAEMLGIDYSETSVALAMQIAKAQGNESIQFRQADFMANPDWTTAQYDCVLDKGTLDAIALSGQLFEGKKATERYAEAVTPLVKAGGIFLITSCNFTEEELAQLFGKPYERIEYPTFSFGGAKGSTVVSLAFSF